MHIFSLIFSVLNAVLLIVQFYFGYFERANYIIIGFHQIIGIFIAMSVVLNHVIIMFYFIGSGKYIKDTVLAANKDIEMIKETRKFKSRLFPFCFFSIVTVCVAAITGSATSFLNANPHYHFLSAFLTLILNIVTIPITWTYTNKNRKLLKEVERIQNEYRSY